MARKKRSPTKAERSIRDARAIYSIANALRVPHTERDIDRALLSVVRRLMPGEQTEKQIHALHVAARGAFTRYLRERRARG